MEKEKLLIRNHLLCPYSDCSAHHKRKILRIQIQVNDEEGRREVTLKQTIKGKIERTGLPYGHAKEEYNQKCPYCQRPVIAVIDETGNGRNISLRLPQ
jgi:hypothetical protein